ncbi:MAG: hypothetical protein H6831_14050 [Planctomycetes bacterium]|nr:hypothetical protein [Planctomycetota bacterium]MCB9905523.1 hypothetical protein [Planctomycetota bacterium]
MTPVLERTRHHADALLAADERERRLLEAECGDRLPLWHDGTPEGLELEGCQVGQLDVWIRRAPLGWREVLVAAEFADEPTSHEGNPAQRRDAPVSSAP